MLGDTTVVDTINKSIIGSMVVTGGIMCFAKPLARMKFPPKFVLIPTIFPIIIAFMCREYKLGMILSGYTGCCIICGCKILK